MNKFIVLLILITFGQSVTAQTYYYRYTKSIIKGVENTNVSGGQFITFDGKRCYESDKFGNNVGNGSMSYDAENSRQVETYWGSCYWSKNAYMKFNADKSLMNIETNAGKIYVYKRATAPAGITTCSLIREKETNSGSSGGGGVYIPSVNPNQPQYPQGGYQGGSTTNNPTYEKPEREKKQWRTITKQLDCNHCGHSGKCSTCNGKGWYYTTGVGTNAADCPNCDGFKTGRCRYCHGAGYTTKTERVYE